MTSNGGEIRRKDFELLNATENRIPFPTGLWIISRQLRGKFIMRWDEWVLLQIHCLVSQKLTQSHHTTIQSCSLLRWDFVSDFPLSGNSLLDWGGYEPQRNNQATKEQASHKGTIKLPDALSNFLVSFQNIWKSNGQNVTLTSSCQIQKLFGQLPGSLETAS